jgi:hypothetical protein
MEPTDPDSDPDPQHWSKPFYLVLYMIFCGVVYLQQLQVLYCCLMSGLCLLYVWLLFYVPNLAKNYRRLLPDVFESFLADSLNNKQTYKSSADLHELCAMSNCNQQLYVF